jgi:hypothetical protein
MTLSYSPEDVTRDLTGVSPSPAAFSARKMPSRRWRGLARRAIRRTFAALDILHRTIVAAKMRRLRREMMMLHADTPDELLSPDAAGSGPNRDLLKFPQRPLILGEKWDY